MIDAIKELIEDQHTASNAAFNGKWYLEGYANSIVLSVELTNQMVLLQITAPGSGGTPVAFSIAAVLVVF